MSNSSRSCLHLIVLFQGGQHGVELVEVEAGRDLDVGDQSKNIAAENPKKLKELQSIFDREAKKYNVYPLDASFAERADVSLRPSLTRGRKTFTYYLDKMPFKFTGTLSKVVIELGNSGLAAGDEKKLEDASKKLADVRD